MNLPAVLRRWSFGASDKQRGISLIDLTPIFGVYFHWNLQIKFKM